MANSNTLQKERDVPEGTADLGLLDDGTVVLQFSKLLKQMTFTPAQAKQLGLGFIEMATRAESVQRVQPPARTSSMLSKRKH